MSWYLFLATLREQTIIWIFINISVYFLEKYDGLSESVAFGQNWDILLTRMGQREDPMKMNLDYFQIKKMNITTS